MKLIVAILFVTRTIFFSSLQVVPTLYVSILSSKFQKGKWTVSVGYFVGTDLSHLLLMNSVHAISHSLHRSSALHSFTKHLDPATRPHAVSKKSNKVVVTWISHEAHLIDPSAWPTFLYALSTNKNDMNANFTVLYQ